METQNVDDMSSAQLMVEHKVIDANNEHVIMPLVIKPNFLSATSCPIPLCTSCQLVQAKAKNPGETMQQYIEERDGILSADALS